MQVKKRKTVKRIIIILCSIIAVCVLVYLIVFVSRAYKEDKRKDALEQEVKQYTSVTDFKTIEEVLVYLDSELIYEQKPTSENDNYIVYAKLKYNTDLENKYYYDKLINYSASVTGFQNLYIIDSNQNVEVFIQCNKGKSILCYYINGEKFFFEKSQSNEDVLNYKEEKIINTTVSSEIIGMLISNGWKTKDVNFGTKNSTYKNYDIYFNEGYDVRKINGQVFNIVFNKRYNQNIVGNLNVGSSKEDITKELGEPSFKTGVCIGYKTNNFYIFFEEGQISIYPIIEYSSDNILKIIDEYEGKDDISKYLSKVKQEWPDYDIFRTSESSTVLQYTLKGICFKYDVTPNRGVVLYSNYTGAIDSDGTNLKQYADNKKSLPGKISYYNEDLVFSEEIKRFVSIEEYSKNSNFAQFPVLNASSKFKTVTDDRSGQVYFVAFDNEYANSELREDISYGIWYDDYKFIYSVKGRGIYLYDAKEIKYSTIVSGNGTYELKKIEDGNLYYDDLFIEIKL